MNIRHLLLAAAWAALSAPAAFAHGGAGHAAAPHPYDAAKALQTPFGRQGDPRQVSRAITLTMSDDMRFTPAVIVVRRGETVRLNVVNKGQVLHELVLGTADDLRHHADLMRRSPGMEHEEPHMAHVAPGQRGLIVWQFNQPGEFPFACLLPGHFEAGMAGKVVVR